MAQPLAAPYNQFLDDNGEPLSGGKVYTYVAGTNTPQDSYTDASGTIPAANPVILDSAGRATIWLAGYYKITVADSNDVIIRTVDDITAVNSIAAGSITNTDLAVMGANTVKANATSGSASPTDVALGLSQLLGRGSSGNISPITLGSGLTMTGTTLAAGSAGLVIREQVFTATGTYTPHANMLYCEAEVVGGGGGGGSASGATSIAGGGGAGGYGRSYISKATIGASQAVTIGAGGASISNGGTSSLGALISCTGGIGAAASAATNGPGGLGGSSTGATTNVNGTAGDYGLTPYTGKGASSVFGAGGNSRNTAGTGNVGIGFGSGGSGASSNPNAGGAGAPGYIRITEYCSA